MNYDGIFIKAQISEILNDVKDEHIAKITVRSQYEVDFHIHKNGKNLVFSLSADPNFPHILISANDVENTDVPSAFCMLLRKYLRGGRIIDIRQVNSLDSVDKNTLERIVDIVIENIDEIGDKNTYHLFIEIMGKYSNIILTDKKYYILDVLKKDPSKNARLKQKTMYDIKSICTKKEILSEDETPYEKTLKDYKAICEINNEKYDTYDAISKSYAGVSRKTVYDIKDIGLHDIQNAIRDMIGAYKNTNETLISYIEKKHQNINDTNEKKNVEEIVKSLYNKLNKKLDLVKGDIAKTSDFERYKKYGELLQTYGYDKSLIKGDTIACEDYNNGNAKVEITLDSTLDMPGNIKKYFDKYNKLKRTKEKANEIYNETLEKIEHLNSIKDSLALSNDKYDIYLIKEEIISYFSEAKKSLDLKKQRSDQKNRKNKNGKMGLNYNIHHYKSSSGIDIYVGKNNLQNEYLTFTLASSDDTWLHIKGATGSHVIVKKPYEALDDKALIEAASLAAYFSEKRNETKATVDYTLRKELKKVKGKPPGFVIYHKNFSINVKPEITISEIL